MTTYSAEVLTSTPLVYLRLGESSGTVATDSSGNSRTGTYYNTPTLGVTGLLTNDADLAMQPVVHYTFPSTTEYVSCPLPAWSSSCTVEVWIRVFPGGSGRLFASGLSADPVMYLQTASGGLVWRMYVYDPGNGGVLGTNNKYFDVDFSAPSAGSTIVSQAREPWFDVADGLVHHVVGTYNTTTAALQLYIDGRLRRHVTYDEFRSTAIYTATPVTLPLAINLSGTTIADFGGNLVTGAYGGILDEVAVYSTVLSASTIASHFATGSDRINTTYDVVISLALSPSIATAVQGSLGIEVGLTGILTSTFVFAATTDIEIGLTGVLSVVPLNDLYANRIVLSGNVGQVSYDLYAATATGGEPAFLTGAHTIWYEWTANADGQLTLTTGPDRTGPTSTIPWIDTLLGVYTGGGLTVVGQNDDKAGVDGQISEVLFTATAGVTYYFAVDAGTSVANNGYADAASQSGYYAYGPGTLDWALRTFPPVAFSTGTGSTVSLPATMTVSIANLPAGTTSVDFYWDATLLATVAVSASGVLLNQTIVLPVSDTVGPHILGASVDGGASFVAVFTVNVIQGSVVVPVDPIFPVVVAQSGVIKWVLDDPLGSPSQYIFPINPNAMTSPFGSKNITARASTGPNGTKIAWEGAQGPTDWQWTGDLFSQQMYDALRAWVGKGNRVFLTDHLLRRWDVYLTEFTPIPKRSVLYPWRNTYTMKALVMAPPVDVS